MSMLLARYHPDRFTTEGDVIAEPVEAPAETAQSAVEVATEPVEAPAAEPAKPKKTVKEG